MNNLIIKKVILIAEPGPVPAPRTTRFTVEMTESDLTFGISSAVKAWDAEAITVDWGDGNLSRITGNLAELSHTYAKSGVYTVTLDDSVTSFAVSNANRASVFRTKYPQRLVSVVSDALRLVSLDNSALRAATNLVSADFAASALKTLENAAFDGCTKLVDVKLPPTIEALGSSVFLNCTALEGELAFPKVTRIEGTTTQVMPFGGCLKVARVVFAKANEEAVVETTIYKLDSTLGAKNAEVVFV